MAKGARSRGATMVESLVVLGLVALMTGLGVGTLRAGWAKTRLASVSDSFYFHLMLARSEALKRRHAVVLCIGGGDGCESQGEWTQGWLLFADPNGNGQRDAGESVLLRHEALPAAMRAMGNQSVARYVAFDAQGRTRLVGGGFQAGTLTFCTAGGGQSLARSIVIASSGRPRLTWTDAAACP